jgi:hypothetical protein
MYVTSNGAGAIDLDDRLPLDPGVVRHPGRKVPKLADVGYGLAARSSISPDATAYRPAITVRSSSFEWWGGGTV